MFRKLSLSVLLMLASASASRAADPVHIVISAGYSTGTGDFLEQAKVEFERRYGTGLIELETPGSNVTPEQIRRANVIFLVFPESRVAVDLAPELERAVRRGAHLVMTSAVPRQWTFTPDEQLTKEVDPYWDFGGPRNVASMLAHLYRKAGGTRTLDVPAPVEAPTKGIYHPRADRDFSSLEDYLEWYRDQRIVPPDAPLIAITFHYISIRQGDMAHFNAIIEELERNGIGAVPVYGWPLFQSDAFLTTRDGKSPLRVILGMNVGMAPRPQDQQWLADHGVHAINLQVTSESYQQWEASTTGLPAGMIPSQVGTPETFSTAEPMLVATTEVNPRTGARITTPVAERVSAVVKRAKRWIALQDKPNSEKRVAFVYYNWPPGKGNISAAYLQVFPTMATMIARMASAGYQIGPLPTARNLQDTLEARGRNVETWAPGELQAMLDSGGMTLFPVEEYKKYFRLLPEKFQKQVMDEYGAPENTEMLRVRRPDGKHYFLIPGARYGNVLLSVQPLEASSELAESTQHDPLHPVPHSYVAAYLYFRYVFKADAVVHIGRHGTLEWRMGKGVMQAGWDTSEALLDGMPNPYLYLMDGGGEAIQAMRRSAAVNMSHLTPLLIAGGEQAEFQPLREALTQSADKEATQAVLADEYKKQALAEIRRLKLDQQLDLKLDTAPWPEVRKHVEEWLEELQETAIPAGMHALGTLPAEEVMRESLLQYLKYGFADKDLPLVRNEMAAWSTAIFEGQAPVLKGTYPARISDQILKQWADAKSWIENLRLSPRTEVDALITVLSGHYLPASPVGDPLKSPAGLPTGTKQYGFDPSLIPTKAAWEVGRRMAEETLALYKEKHGTHPEKISIVLWYGETIGHHGVMESMALNLMGVKVGWNARNQPDELTLVPDAEMTHPRVDVLFNVTGMYRDGFGDKINLLSRAIRLAAAAGDNVISRHDRENVKALVDEGVELDKADKIGRARFFGPKPGTYGDGMRQFVDQSKNAEDPDGIARLKFHYMSYAYSPDIWGETAPKALESQLRGNQMVLFSRSSNLVGALDSDDVYGMVGSLSNASKFVNGEAPDFYINNLRKSGSERPVDLKTWLSTELNQRNWNRKWLEHMKNSNYAGARQMADGLDFLYGFQATTPDSMDGTFWQNSYDVYVADKYGMELDKFFEKDNPHARQGMLARFLQVDHEGSYKFSDAERDRMIREYVRSVNAHGVACSANICGNPRLQQAVAEAAGTVSGLGDLELHKFGETLARATHWNLSGFQKAPVAIRRGMMAA
ncbi:MAG: cobaltochelatase subunit CobN, partial [Vicinamibacterales bacterium]